MDETRQVEPGSAAAALLLTAEESAALASDHGAEFAPLGDPALEPISPPSDRPHPCPNGTARSDTRPNRADTNPPSSPA